MITNTNATLAVALIVALTAPALADEQVETLADSGRFYQNLDPLLARQPDASAAMSYARAPTPGFEIRRAAPTFRNDPTEELWFQRATGHAE
jgi:hypothetical protein